MNFITATLGWWDGSNVRRSVSTAPSVRIWSSVIGRSCSETNSHPVPHESRSGDRGFQILCSRRLKFDGFDYIGDPDLTPVLERRLRPQNVSFAELGERESLRLLDGYLELLSRESRV